MRFGQAVKKVQEGHESMFMLMNTIRNLTPLLNEAIEWGRKAEARQILDTIMQQFEETRKVLYPEEDELHTESKGVSSDVRASDRKRK